MEGQHLLFLDSDHNKQKAVFKDEPDDGWTVLTDSNMIIKLVAVAAALASAASASAPFLVSNVPLCHEEAVSYCAAQGSRLADVNTANRGQAIAQLGGDAAWIGSWDYNGYNSECLTFINGHVGPEQCNFKQRALCNPIVVYDASSSSSSSRNARLLSDLQKAGPSQKSHSSRSSRPCPVESSSSSSCFSSSSSSCVPNFCDSSSSSGCDPEYRYVYLTNTVTSIQNVQLVITSTSTTTFYLTIGTVAAYTVTGGA
jgi:hypothetical protein